MEKTGARKATKVIPIRKNTKPKYVTLSEEEDLANEFLSLAKRHNKTIIFQQEVANTFFFLTVHRKKLTVTTVNERSVFQPREDVAESEYTLLSIAQIGPDTRRIPTIIHTLMDIGCPVKTINTLYQLRAYFD